MQMIELLFWKLHLLIIQTFYDLSVSTMQKRIMTFETGFTFTTGFTFCQKKGRFLNIVGDIPTDNLLGRGPYVGHQNTWLLR